MANLKLGVTIGGNVAIHAGNYNNYAPTLTGGNASGTWNINVTGSAATLTTARTITIGNTGKTFNGSANLTWTLAEIGAQPAGSYLTSYTETDTLATVTSRGNTTTGAINVQGTLEFDTYLFGDGKYVINVGDSWLRLNQNGDFGSGVYTPYILRNDGLLINYGGGRLYNGLIVEGETKLGSGAFKASTDQSFGSYGNYTFRDAVSIWNPNGTSAPNTTTVMSIGSMSNGISLVASGRIDASGGNSSNWNTAYDNSITAVAVSGGPTKTLTLTQQDGGTLTATWSDVDTDTDTNTYLTSASFNTTNGVLTLTRNDSVTVTVDLDGRFYTQSESDGRYVNVTGDVMTGALGISTGTAGIDSFYVDGTYGRLFTVTDDLSDAVFSVNTISGLPIIEAYSDYSVRMGRYGQNDFYINPSGNTGFGTASPAYKVDVTGSLRVSANIYVGGYLEPDGQSMNLRKVNSISFSPNNGWNDPYVHGIMSTDSGGSNSDSVSINSYNDITLRLDANNNNADSYLRIMNNTSGGNTIAYIGYDGSTNVAWFGGVATAANDFRAPIFYDLADTNYYVDPNSTSVLYSINSNRIQVTNDLTTSSGQGRFGGWYTGTGYTGAAVEVGFSGSRGYVISYSRSASAYQPLELNGSNIYIIPNSGNIYVGNQIIRQAAGQGWLSGNYASSETVATTGAIYSIGGSYYPTNTALNTMYGVGYTHVDQGQMPSGATSWGFYVAANGVARVWLGGDSGNIIATGNIYAETNRIVATQAWVQSQNYLTSVSDVWVNTSGDTMTGQLFISSTNQGFNNLILKNNSTGSSMPTHYFQRFIARYNNDVNGTDVYHWVRDSWEYNITNTYSDITLGAINNGTTYVNLFKVSTDGNVYATNSFRAPIFYDSANTNYYLDPNSNTSIRTVGSWRADSSDWDGEFSGKMQYHANNWYIQGADTLIYRNAGGANVFYVNQAGVATAANDFRAPIFYDSNDTNYYVDPNGTSNISQLFAVGKYHKFGASTNWDNGSLNGANSTITNVHFQGHDDFWIGAGNSRWYSSVLSGHHDLLINTMQSGGSNYRGITFTASSGGSSVYRLGRWHSATTQADSYLNIDGALVVGSTNLYYQDLGTSKFQVHGTNGLLFSVDDDLSDSIFSANTISGLPVIEAFADYTVKLGRFSNPVIIDASSNITIPGTITASGYNSSNWNTAYNKRPTAVAFSGTSTKTLTLTLGDGSTLTAAFNDIDTDTNTDGQTLSISGSTLTISGGNSVTLPTGGISQATADTLYQPLENQRLRTSDTVRFSNTYTSAWFRNDNSNTGLYNEATTMHLSSNENGFWDISSTNTESAIRFYTGGHKSALRGYVYSNSSSQIGFLTGDGNWGLQVDSSKNVRVYGVSLTVGNTTSSDIYMVDSDEGNRRIHCNSGRVGFLSTSNTWGSWAASDGSWYSDQSMRAPIFYDLNDTNYYVDAASTSVLNTLRVNNHIRQGNNQALPLVKWGASGSSTGAVIIKLPGGSGNYGMVHMQINIYEYNGNNVSTVIVGGHNWASRWYSYGAKTVGNPNKQIRLGFRDGQYCVVIGDASSAWSYGSVALVSINNGEYYNNNMDLSGSYSISQVADDTFDWVSEDLNGNTDVPTADYANTAGSANSVAWTNVSGRPTNVSSFTNDSGYITSSGRAYPRRADGTNINFYWSGQGGQPTWLWGSNDGENFYVWNPSNFSVNYATTAGSLSSMNISQFTNNSGYLTSETIGTGNTSGVAGAKYQINDEWLRVNSDNRQYQVYGNSRTIIWRTDGNTNEHGGGGYAYIWYYGGSSDGNRRLILETNGDVWSNTYGWFHDYFQRASSAINTSNIGSQSVNYASSAGSATNVVTIQDAAPGGSAGKLWWESDTGKLKVYYNSAWVDASPIPDMNVYYPKAGGSITGDVVITQTLTVVGNTLVQGTFTETSDISLKENIVPLTGSLDKVLKLNGVSFNKKETPELTEIGFIAQEVEEVIPELVSEMQDGIKTVSYSRVAAVLVETIKEQQAQIEELKDLVVQLSKKLDNL